jgi:hypothetical protein
MAVPTTTNVKNPRGMGYGFALDGHLFRLAVGPGRELTISTAPPEAQRINTASNPEELAAEYGITFARSQFDGGEGLYRAHVEGASPSRFWDSKNVSVTPAGPGEFPEIKLLPKMDRISEDFFFGTTDVHLLYDEKTGTLYASMFNDLLFSTDPFSPTPSFEWEDPSPHGAEPTSTSTYIGGVVMLGDDDIYIALGTNGIHKKTAGVWTHWSDVLATRIWSVKGRIVASDGRNLYEVLAGGAAPSPLLTLPPGKVWTDAVDGGSHVLCTASDGYVYAFVSDAGALSLVTQTPFEGEYPTAIGQSQGVVMIGTTSPSRGRLYIGSLSTTGQVEDLTLVKEWSTGHPRTVVGNRSSLITSVEDGTDTHLWKYDLRTGGLSRDLTVDAVSESVIGLLRANNRVFVGIKGGVYRESTFTSDEGYLISPLADFVSSAAKSWVASTLETGELGDGRVVELYYTTDPEALLDPDSTAWTLAMRRDAGGGLPVTEPLPSTVSRSLAGMVKLYSTGLDGAPTPTVRSFSFAAYASSGDEDLIVTLPVNVSDHIERRGVARRRAPGAGDAAYRMLMSFEGKPVLLELFAPKRAVRGVLEQVGTPVSALTKRGSTTAISMARVRGKYVGVEGTTSGAGVFGTRSTFATPPAFGTPA